MRIVLSFFVLLLISCSSKKEHFFKNSLDSYIEKHPINVLYEVDSVGNRSLLNCVHPYYQAEFTRGSDGIIALTIRQKMYYTEDESSELPKPTGYFIYKKQPIIVIDGQKLSNDYLFTSLKTSIPDSLKYEFDKCDGQLIHNKNNRPITYKAE